MKQIKILLTVSWVLLAMLALDTAGFAESIKERMKSRLPDIIELKSKGLVGENFYGYLEFIGDEQERKDVVAAENKDRRKVYQAIAQQQDTTAELVGKRRALQIAENADPGEWLQDASGNWYQKE